jgi:hypothetical protein
MSSEVRAVLQNLMHASLISGLACDEAAFEMSDVPLPFTKNLPSPRVDASPRTQLQSLAPALAMPVNLRMMDLINKTQSTVMSTIHASPTPSAAAACPSATYTKSRSCLMRRDLEPEKVVTSQESFNGSRAWSLSAEGRSVAVAHSDGGLGSEDGSEIEELADYSLALVHMQAVNEQLRMINKTQREQLQHLEDACSQGSQARRTISETLRQTRKREEEGRRRILHLQQELARANERGIPYHEPETHVRGGQLCDMMHSWTARSVAEPMYAELQDECSEKREYERDQKTAAERARQRVREIIGSLPVGDRIPQHFAAR